MCFENDYLNKNLIDAYINDLNLFNVCMIDRHASHLGLVSQTGLSLNQD